MRRSILLVILLVVLPLTSGLMVKVEVMGTIEGNAAYYEIEDGTQYRPHRFLVSWENVGSVGCGIVLRADVYEVGENKSVHIYTAWSEGTPAESGETIVLETYWLPEEPGNYEVNLSVILCHKFSQLARTNFTIEKASQSFQKAPFEIKNMENNKSWVSFEIESSEDIHELIIIPTKYPLGWSVESKSVGQVRKNKVKEVSVSYESGIWKEKELTFEILDKYGNYRKTIVYKLLKEGTEDFWKKWTIPILIFLIIILALSNVCLLQRERLSRFKKQYLTKEQLESKLDKFRKESARKRGKKD